MHARHSRTLRGMTAAAVATWLAAVSHTIGGGTAPDGALLLVVTALAAPLGVALAGRRLGLVRLSLTVILTQVLLHVAFAWTAGLDPAAATGHVHGGALPTGGQATAVLPDLGMMLAHALAALLTIALLHRGERAARVVARGLRELVARLVVSLGSPVTPPPVPVPAEHPSPIGIRVARVVPLRGPPVLVTAAR